jgi:hypothetical protein
MATYLSGVTDYIPQLQPFQPDLNLYSNVLQTKQTQYDTAWKAINKVYSQYFYADLTREDNLKKKEQLMQNIDFNLKRVSGMDLSLSQNVAQATQVFKPYYEDNGIMKDMAWTKNFNSQVARSEGYKNSDNEEQRKRYWDTGVQALNYMRDEFKEASASDALAMGNAKYTDNVNVQEKALKIAKDADLNIESVTFSPDGRWLVKKTNGDQLIEPLGKLFEAQLGNDPAIQAVYKTQAYVDRKDYAYSNAAQFKGDKNAAEMKYLETNFNMLKEQNQRRFQALKQESEGYSAKIADIKKQVENGTASPTAQQALRQYEEAKQINDAVLTRTEKENSELSTGSTSTGFQNPYGDIKSLRWKVDNARASMLMQKELGEAAQTLAYRNAKVDMDANPYAVNEQQHGFRMKEAAYRMNRMESIAKMKAAAERRTELDKTKIKNGTHYEDENGQVIPYEIFNSTYVKKTDQGTSTDRFSIKEMSYNISKLHTRSVAQPFLQTSIDLFRGLKKDGVVKSDEIKRIFGMDLQKFEDNLAKNPDGFLRTLGSKKLNYINSAIKSWVGRNKDLSGLNSQTFDDYQSRQMEFGQYVGYVKSDESWRRASALEVEKDLYRQGFKNARFAYDLNGNLRSEKQFFKALKDNKVITGTEYNALIGSKNKTSLGQNLALSAGAGFLLGPIAAAAGTTASLGKALYDKVFGPDVEDYNDLKSAAWKSYASGKIKTKAPLPGLDKFGQDMGSGKFAMGVTTSSVNPKGITASRAWYNEAMADIQNGFDWGDPSKNIITFGGTSATAIKNATALGKARNDKGNVLLSQIFRETQNSKTKMGNFEFGVLPIVGGKANKAAIIVYPDMDWLKKFVYKTDKEGKQSGPGYISYKEWERIGVNGIAAVMDANKMNNSFYKNAYSSPLQSLVDYNGGYTYSNPKNPDQTWSVTPDKLGRGYFTTVKFPSYDANGNKEMMSISDPTPITGESLNGVLQDVTSGLFPQLDQMNVSNYNNR